MKKIILSIIFISNLSILFAQRSNTDIFGNVIYESYGGAYQAKLTKDIFDNLIFTDNRDNKLTFDKKYLSREYPNISSGN